MKPFRGVFSTRPQAGDPSGSQALSLAHPAQQTDVAPGLVSPRSGPKHLLWEVLVELGFVDERRVLEAEAVARASRQDLGAVLLERGLVSSEQLARAVAQREGVLYADLATYAVDEDAVSLITPAVAERYGAIPIGYGPGGEVLLALANPRERHAVNDISMMVEPSVTRVVATQESIDLLIRTRKEQTSYKTEPGEEPAGIAVEADLAETAAAETDETSEPLAEAAEAWSSDEVPAYGALAPDDLTLNGHASGGPPEHGLVAAGADERPQWLDAALASQPQVEEEASGEPESEPESDAHDESDRGREPESSSDSSPDPERESQATSDSAPDREASEEPNPHHEPDAVSVHSLDRELLESLTRSVEQVDRLVRETARGRDADLEAAAADSERRLSKLQVELDREFAERADTEGSLREQLETERAARGESERKLREDAEVERTSREQLERSLREELETERATREESERVLREELETERATREALATELAAVRTARDDLARRVASARDLLELGARPFVPLNGRER